MEYRVTKRGKIVLIIFVILIAVIIFFISYYIGKRSIKESDENNNNINNLIFGYNDFFDKYKYHEEKIIIGEKRKTIIYFLPDSAKLTENANVILSDIPIYDEQIVIEGNVNGFPNCEDSFGMLLAQERAENVKTYLVEKGLSSKKITIINNGCKKPVNKDDTEKELRKNRRVEIYYVNI